MVSLVTCVVTCLLVAIVSADDSDLSNPNQTCLDSSSNLGRECPSKCNISDTSSTCNVVAAVVLPANNTYELSLNKVLPVLESARMFVMNNKWLPSNVNLTFVGLDDRCSNVYSIFRALSAYSHCAHVLLGPACEYALAPVGRIVKFWGTPLLTAGGLTWDYTDNKMTCDSEFHMVVSVGPMSFRGISYFLLKIMREHDWRKVFLIYEKHGYLKVSGEDTCKLMMDSLAGLLKKEEDIIYDSYDTALNTGGGFKENLRRELQYTYSSTITRYTPPDLTVTRPVGRGFQTLDHIHRPTFLTTEGYGAPPMAFDHLNARTSSEITHKHLTMHNVHSHNHTKYGEGDNGDYKGQMILGDY